MKLNELRHIIRQEVKAVLKTQPRQVSEAVTKIPPKANPEKVRKLKARFDERPEFRDSGDLGNKPDFLKNLQEIAKLGLGGHDDVRDITVMGGKRLSFSLFNESKGLEIWVVYERDRDWGLLSLYCYDEPPGALRKAVDSYKINFKSQDITPGWNGNLIGALEDYYLKHEFGKYIVQYSRGYGNTGEYTSVLFNLANLLLKSGKFQLPHFLKK